MQNQENVLSILKETAYFDNTMLSAYRQCNRKYFFRHIRHWTPSGANSPALVFGTSWHAAMDTVWGLTCRGINGGKTTITKKDIVERATIAFINTWVGEGLSLDDGVQLSLYPRSIGRAQEMLDWYVEKYYDWLQDATLMSIEDSFTVPLGIDKTMYMGRLDKVFTHPTFDNKIVILDHKTTSIEASSWYESFSPNSQIDGYIYAGNMLYGAQFWGAMIDGATVMKGTKGKEKRTDKDMPAGISFPRIPISRQLNQLDAWHWETTDTIASILNDIDVLSTVGVEMPYLPAFPKNTTACFYYGACIYKDICKMVANPACLSTPEGFIESVWTPMK